MHDGSHGKINISKLHTIFENRIQNITAMREYGSQYINGIKGWYFSDTMIQQAAKDDTLLTIDYEIPSSCWLRCAYCFRNEDERDKSNKRLDWAQWTDVIDQCTEMGLKSVKIIGDGETTENNLFFDYIKYISDKGILPLIFTSGYVMGNDYLARKIHGMCGEDMIKRLFDLNASIIIKMDSFDHIIQDTIVNRSGYASIRDNALLMLYDKGFAAENPTRLGVEVNVGYYNFDELLIIYMLKPVLNIYVDLVTTMPCGNYFRNENEVDIHINRKIELYNDIYSINKQIGIPFDGISPFIGGMMCSQLGYGLYINCCGEVFACPASFESLGNVINNNINNIWKKNTTKEKYKGRRHSCIYREEYGILPKNLDQLIDIDSLMSGTLIE